ncbi:myb/sant-like DNA-binding domain-containing protein 4 [Plakobranchus ocellatus]|uniref:Myb/sant-like DNA-binding domain-containing protein 4 n=1 Tax=Plakobranchus ocellatus TaxID=259542 RepID=A0AAV4DL45_9GAST|nr:myb/sant-like DNA-binding domain-containing protein 4 [Plakobranchus ocellatus]
MDFSDVVSDASSVAYINVSNLLESHNRIRNWRFTDNQIQALLKLVRRHRNVICKSEKSNTNYNVWKKREAWKVITAAVNAAEPGYPRTPPQVKKKWNDLKGAVQVYLRNHDVSDKGDKPAHFYEIVSICGYGSTSADENGSEVVEENGTGSHPDISEQMFTGALDPSSKTSLFQISNMRSLTTSQMPQFVPRTAKTSAPNSSCSSSSITTSILWETYLREEIKRSQLQQEALQKDLEMKDLLKLQLELDINLKRLKAQFYQEKIKSLASKGNDCK